MFSFNLRSVNFAIGNLVLPKDEYMKLKAKLVEDIQQELSGKKEVPTMIDIIAGCTVRRGQEILPKTEMLVNEQNASTAKVPNGFELVEAAFRNASAVLFGRPLKGLKEYGAWLEAYEIGSIAAPSAVSGMQVYGPAFEFYRPIAKNFVRLSEALTLGSRAKIARDAAEELRLENASAVVNGLAYVSPEIVFGRSMNVIDCGDYQNAVNIYRGSFVFDSKNIAYSFFPKFCEDAYGCHMLLSCKYCMRCRNSTNLNRCFEVTDSNNCSDCYFCHNCENVQDSMFCFNTKSKRYAIGNVEVGREKYMRIKKLVLDEIAGKLEKGKRLDLGIYSLSGKRA
ncbi:Uncharacterised protein [uncultured archaeon]|nr:Uncharacterised protein [uncultured archaeon]